MSRRTILGGLLVSMCLAACADDPMSRDGETIGTAGGMVAAAGGSVDVPAGALSRETTIAIAEVFPDAALPSFYEAAGPALAFTPHGQSFATPVTITVPFTGSGGSVALFRLDDEADSTWELVGGEAFRAGVATYQTSSFSVYVVGRLVEGRDAGGPDMDLPDADLDARGPDADADGPDAGDGGPPDDMGTPDEDGGPPEDMGPPVDAGPCGRGAYTRALEIRSNADVATLAGYTGINGALSVTGGVTSLEGLECLTSAQALDIYDTTALRDLRGLSALTTVGLLAVTTNAALTSLDGLGAITSVVTEVRIRENPQLTQIDALASLSSVGWGVDIGSNPMLQSVEGLNALETARELIVTANDSLASIELDSLRSVERNLIVSSSPMVASVRLSALTTAPDGLNIENLETLTSLDLGLLRETGDLYISTCPALTSITGTGALATSESGVALFSLPALVTITPFSSLTSTFRLDLQYTGLTTIAAFPALSSLEQIVISSNPQLTTLSGLDPLATLGERLTVTNNVLLSECLATAFRDRLVLAGFTGTATIEGNLVCP